MSKEAVTPPPSEVTNTEEYEGEEYYGEDYWELPYGQEVVEEEEEKEEEVEEIYYDTKDFISKPYLSEKCTLPEDILEFDYSYGYDCQKLFNLCVIDTVVLIFASGNIIHFFDTSTGKKWYRRCFSGSGIGHITKNPVEPHIAVGEKGENPFIIIYEWPSFEIITVLKGGTKKAFTFLNYSPDGELLCSQGAYPDYMLTIWNWKKHRIMLRSKAYGQTVFNSKFSLFVPGHLTSSGISHIKFWKINRTFTGLKLLGELGRFGKSEICNIIGFVALPDEKVVSGCEWGNILVWDGGLIRVEVFRRGKSFCHEAPITQFIYNNGELTTVAMDGTIKVWYYETIELADPPEEDRFIEVEPIFEYEVGDYYHRAKLLLIVEADSYTSSDSLWYGQDGNGGIWQLDLSMSIHSKPAVQIMYCHAGKVAAIQCSPCTPHLASLGEDGRIFIYDYSQQVMIMRKEFFGGGCSLLWLPLAVEDSGSVLIAGFSDGVIRVICISLYEYYRKVPSPTDEYINLIQVFKPHTKPVTFLTINYKHTVIVTGSDDCTIFLFKIKEGQQYINLEPMGYIPVPGEVSHCEWKPKKEATLLVSCKNGIFCELELPHDSDDPDPVSYLLTSVRSRQNRFVSVKSEYRRNMKMAEVQAERQKILEEKKLELEKKVEDTGVAVDIVTILDALKEELEAQEVQLPELYIPPVPNRILFAYYVEKTVLLSMSGFDAGYLYQYNFQKEGPLDFRMVDDADDIEITSHHTYHNHKYLILGMGDGKVRVVRVNPSDHLDLSDYWSLSMHDNDIGTINQICFNYNFSYMFTCGNDGNIFSYKFTPENYEFKHVNIENVAQKGFPSVIPPDIDELKAPSLEEAKNRKEYEEKMKEANIYKKDLMEVLKDLEKSYEALVRRSAKLPKSMQFTTEEFLLDKRIEADLNASLEEEMNSMKFRLAWQFEKTKILHDKASNYYINEIETHSLKVFGINNKEIYAETYRLKKLGPSFDELKKLVQIKMEEQEAKGRGQARLFSAEEIVDTITRRPNPVENLLKQIMALCGDYKKNIKLRRLIRKYRERKDRLESRRIEWYEMMKKKPNPDKPDPEDLASIEYAKETIGDYKLKTAPGMQTFYYKVSKASKVTTVHVYNQLLDLKKEIYDMKHQYNEKILDLRQAKVDMIEKHQQMRDILLEIAKEIPKEKIRYPPNLPSIDEENEFPEKKFNHGEKEIIEELPKRYKAVYKGENLKKKELKLLDREYEMLILEKKSQKDGKPKPKTYLTTSNIKGSRVIEELEELGKDDQTLTPWEEEFKKLRITNRIFEQDKIIEEMDEDIRKFDEEIIRIKSMKYKLDVDLKFLELYIITLHQEVLILKKFEAAEDEKENKLFEKLREKHEIQKKMNELNYKVEGRNREIRKCEEEIKNLVTMFHATVAENKFYDFLRRIFKKKYRPPKVKSDDSDSESESESSSSSEEEDEKSLDSKDIGPIRLDENVCPPGCDPQIYEWTFTQRTARHALELNILEEKRQIDLHKKEYDMLVKKIQLVEHQYLVCKEDLEEFMREKQRNLNQVETVAILYLDQIQNFTPENEIEKLSESIVFSSQKLSSLYKRVGELEKEMLLERQKHEKNRQHLTRMKIDVNHMKELIIKLNKSIEEAMIRKFGKKVDIDDIEESLMKRLVTEMHSVIVDLDRSFEKKLRVIRKDCIEKENQYARKLQDNTERYNLLTVLQEEKLNIKKTFQRQDKILCKQNEKGDEQEKDIENLKKIANAQEDKIQELRNEIASLKLKFKPKVTFPEGKPITGPTVIQKMIIKSCDGDVEEIQGDVRDELYDMCEEAQEIIQDVKEGVNCDKEDHFRMRTLAIEMIEKLPMKCKKGVINRLSVAQKGDQPLLETTEKAVLDDIIKNMTPGLFAIAVQLIKETIDSIIPHLDTIEE